jgi:hypothetical protein
MERQVLKKFSKHFFDKVRAQKASPPYLEIESKRLAIKVFENIAIVTFELEEKNLLDRRTIILERRNAQWLIVHIHASNIEREK